ncbi:MAG: hypothetical protein KDA60_09290 [Planctomycetales bacterium]|nr:hypothetical protein [Planctomycetales bacterium]
MSKPEFDSFPQEPFAKDSAQNRQDLEHLKLLSIFHYVLAAILGLFSCFPVFHLAAGIAIVSGVLDRPNSSDAPPAFLGWIFIGVAGLIIVCGMAMAVSVAIAGQRLKQFRSRTYCFVIAGLECLFSPFGTILGVFTIIVLMRPSVRELFENAGDVL